MYLKIDPLFSPLFVPCNARVGILNVYQAHYKNL